MIQNVLVVNLCKLWNYDAALAVMRAIGDVVPRDFRFLTFHQSNHHGAGSQTSVRELRERKEREEGQEAEAEELGAAEGSGTGEEPTAVLTHALLHGIGRRGVGRRGALSFISFPLSSSFGAFISFLGTGLGGGQREACNEPPLRGLRTGKPGKMYAAKIYIGRM